MKEDVKLRIENVGLVNDAEISINKINIITGENATGKSTVSKILYCFLKSFLKNNEVILKKLNKDLNDLLILIKNFSKDKYPNIYKKINKNSYTFNYSKDQLKKVFLEFKMYNNEMNSEFEIINNKIQEISIICVMLESNAKKLHYCAFNYLFDSEFGKDYLNNGKLCFESSSNDFSFSKDSQGMNLNGDFLVENVYYIDSSLSIANIGSDYLNINHSNNKKFSNYNTKINDLSMSISEIIGGKLLYKNNSWKYFTNGGIEIPLKDTALGVKQFAIIQALLEKSLLKDSYLILDEPEVNLHPEWQLGLAEILIRIVKEENLILYINTYSSLFIEAISLYAEKYGLLDVCNFYLTRKSKNNEDKFDFTRISQYNIRELYLNLGRPYDDLNDLRYEIKELDD